MTKNRRYCLPEGPDQQGRAGADEDTVHGAS